jgi:hypothetical protein
VKRESLLKRMFLGCFTFQIAATSQQAGAGVLGFWKRDPSGGPAINSRRLTS